MINIMDILKESDYESRDKHKLLQGNVHAITSLQIEGRIKEICSLLNQGDNRTIWHSYGLSPRVL